MRNEENRYYSIRGVTYDSATAAASEFNVEVSTIHGWCNGYTSTIEGITTHHTHASNCYSLPKFED